MENKEENKKKRSEKYTSDKLIYIIFIVIAGFLIDIYVNFTGNTFLKVTESYITAIYGSIIGVAVLCISLIALISDKLEKTYYGYRLKEIILFDESLLNFKKYLCLSFGSMALATGLFFFGYKISLVNTITALMLSEIYLEYLMAERIFDIITNETKCYKIVESYIKQDKVQNGEGLQEKYEREITRLFNSLKHFTEDHNHEKVEKVIELIVVLNERNDELTKKKNIHQFFFAKLKEIITPLSDNFGYNQMVKDIISLSEHSPLDGAERISLFLTPIEEMQYWDDKKLVQNNYFHQIRELYKIPEYRDQSLISDSDIFPIFVRYFTNIMDNQLCTEKRKNNLIVSYIRQLSYLYWEEPDKSFVQVNCKALFDIFKYRVLQNENKEEREYVYRIIVKEIYLNNRFSEKDAYFYTISLMLQAFYAYIFLEKKSLNEEHRNNLKDLFGLSISDITTDTFKFSDVIKNHIKHIIDIIAKRIEINDKTGELFEFNSYFPVKERIWTDKFNAEFLLTIYVIYFNKLKNSQSDKYPNSWNLTIKQRTIDAILDKFDKSSWLINEEFNIQCKQFSDLLDYPYNIDNESQIDLFKSINNEKKKLNDTLSALQKCDIKTITSKLSELMVKEKIRGWVETLNEVTETETPEFSYIEENKRIENDLTTRKIKDNILCAVQAYITTYAKRISLNDNTALTKLSELGNTHNIRNFNLDDLLMLDNHNQDYMDVKKDFERKINYINTPGITIPLLFNEDSFKFNAQIISIEHCKLTDDECDRQLEKLLEYNGYYDVNGALYSRGEAIDVIKKNYTKQKVQYKLIVSFNKEDVLYIDFKY